MRGSKHGAVIKAGGRETVNSFTASRFLPRATISCPRIIKRPLSASDVKLIELWISSGASGTLAADAIKDAPSISSNRAIVAEVTFEEVNPAAVAKQRADVVANPRTASTALTKCCGLSIPFVSGCRGECIMDGLKFGDEQLAALLPLSERIVTADLSSTAITDRSADMIAKMKRLRSLRLMHTKISDTTVQALGPLEQLESVSIFDTPVTQLPYRHLSTCRSYAASMQAERRFQPKVLYPERSRINLCSELLQENKCNHDSFLAQFLNCSHQWVRNQHGVKKAVTKIAHQLSRGSQKFVSVC